MLNHKLFLKNAALFQVLNWLIKPVWIFLIDREVQNTLGEAVYGEYMVLFNFSLLFLIVLDPGMHSYQTREIAANYRFALVSATGLMWFKLLLSLLYFLLVWSLGNIQGFNTQLLLLLISQQILSSWILYFRSVIAGYQHFTYDAILSVLDRFFSIGLVSAFLFTYTLKHSFSIALFLELQLIGLIVSMFFAIWIIKSKKLFWRLRFPEFQKIKKLLITNIPYALLTLIMGMYMRLDVLLIKYWDPKAYSSVGIYAHGFRFLDASSMYVMLFTGMLFPVLTKALRLKSEIKGTIQLVLLLVWIPGIWLVGTAIVYGEDILTWMYAFDSANDLQESSTVFKWLMAAYIPMSGALILGALLTAAARIIALVKISLLALVVLVLCSYFLIPTLGAPGAAIAVFATHSTAFALLILLSYRHFSTFPSSLLKQQFKWLLLSIILLISYGISVSFLNGLWGVLFTSSIYLVSIFFLRLLPFNLILDLIRKRREKTFGKS